MSNHARSALNLPSAIVVLQLLSLAGCSGESDGLPREPISGTVSLDGQPLADGIIQLIPASRQEGTAGGAVVKDGKFSIERRKGLAPGAYRVVISSSLSRGEAAETPGEAPGPVKPSDTPKDLIPSRYNAKSTLKAEVKPGVSNTFDFPLKSQ
ncbi:MAG: carboxypeptidase-like regulatory domain-containing protein [Isosphaeraceae bacterium]|nr:carboxypeptidase-like regulatory domain-containing protein [Isosphaeraceae bacterium]